VFVYDGELLFCVETAFQRAKTRLFLREDLWDPVRERASLMTHQDFQNPEKMKNFADFTKEIGRTRFPEYSDEKWHAVRLQTLFELILAKFVQNPPLANLLLWTSDRLIYEKSFKDFFYASGDDGTGENHSGIALMKVRKFISENPSLIGRHERVDELMAEREKQVGVNQIAAAKVAQDLADQKAEAEAAKTRAEAEETFKKQVDIQLSKNLSNECESHSVLMEKK